MRYLGDFRVGATVHCLFSSANQTGGRAAFSDALEVGDVRVYKNGSSTERSSTAGFTVTSAFDSLVGVHLVSIDTSDNTDAGFYAPGNDYTIVLYPDTETVDSQAPAAILAQFSIENRGNARSGIVYAGTLSAGSVSSFTLSDSAQIAKVADGFIIVCPAKAQARYIATGYNSGTGVGAPDSNFSTALASGDFVYIFAVPAEPTALPLVEVSKVAGITLVVGGTGGQNIGG